MSLDVADSQTKATQRQDLRGVVYALSGTVLSRVSGVPDASVRWATDNVLAANGPAGGDDWEPYMLLPTALEDELGDARGTPGNLKPYPIVVRNLAFQHKESMLAAMVDDDYTWEGSEATLWVAYLQPGQTVADLSSADWSVLRSRGVFGAPNDMRQDAVTLPLFSRDIKRRDKMTLRRATRDDFPEIFPADEGRIIPVVVGKSDTRTRMLRTNAGVFGRAAVARTTDDAAQGIQVDPAPFTQEQWQAAVSGGATFVLQDSNQEIVFDGINIGTGGDNTITLFVTFPAVISGAIPRGGLIHEKKSEYRFTAANQDVTSGLTGGDGISQYNLAFELFDGSVVSETDTAAWTLERVVDPDGINGYRTDFVTNELPVVILFEDSVGVSGTVAVTTEEVDQQPEFTTTNSQQLSDKKNFPTSAVGTAGVTNASNATDGNEDTGASVPDGDTLSVSFGNAPSPFANGDTTSSTLWVHCQGSFLFRQGSAGSTIGTLSAVSKGTFRFVLVSPADYDQTVDCVGQPGSGGVVYDLWWEHDLSTTITLTRSQDTSINVDITTDLPDLTTQMEPVRALLWQPTDFQGLFGESGGNPWRDAPKVGWVQPIPAQLADMQRWLLEDGDPTYANYIDVGNYGEAATRYGPGNLQVSGMAFVLQDEITWPELEAQLAPQLMAHLYYGPEGHRLVPILTPEEYANLGGSQDFRLPGTPASNASVSRGSPLMDRGGLGAVVNEAKVVWERDWLLTDQIESYQRTEVAVNADSQNVYGPKVEDPLRLFAFTTKGLGHTAHVANVASLYANRDAFGVTRFVFETGHRAFSRTQGDIVRVAFAVDDGVFRNVLCEVENIRVSPINGERRVITCRTVAAPIFGLTFNLTWDDLYTDDLDTWTDRITGVFDRWEQYWGTAP